MYVKYIFGLYNERNGEKKAEKAQDSTVGYFALYGILVHTYNLVYAYFEFIIITIIIFAPSTTDNRATSERKSTFLNWQCERPVANTICRHCFFSSLKYVFI